LDLLFRFLSAEQLVDAAAESFEGGSSGALTGSGALPHIVVVGKGCVGGGEGSNSSASFFGSSGMNSDDGEALRFISVMVDRVQGLRRQLVLVSQCCKQA